MHAIVWDLEIATPVESHPDGWAGAKRGECGISSICLYDSETERYHLYDDTTSEDCVKHLNSADLLIGWNSLAFDYPCLVGFTGLPIVTPHYDILDEVWRAEPATRGRGVWRLGSVALRTLGLGKTGSGASAPKLAEEGRYAELFDYNLNDVYLTKRLARHIYDNGGLPEPGGKLLKLTPIGVRL